MTCSHMMKERADATVGGDCPICMKDDYQLLMEARAFVVLACSGNHYALAQDLIARIDGRKK